MHRRRLLLSIQCAIAFVIGLALVAPAQVRAQGKPVVFAAASLKTALDAIAAAWQKETGKSVAISYASSAVLARQIEQGAPADIFISADLDWMDWAEARHLIKTETRETLLGNALVLVGEAQSNLVFKIAPGADLSPQGGEVKFPRLKCGRDGGDRFELYQRLVLAIARRSADIGPGRLAVDEPLANRVRSGRKQP